MTTIFTIDKAIETLLSQVDETGELSEEQLREYEALTLNRQEKIRNTVLYSKHLLGEVDIISKEIDRLKALKALVQRKHENIVKLIKLSVGTEDFDFTTCSVKHKLNPPKVVVEDEGLIPANFFKEKTTKSLDKTALKSALKEGEVEGAKLVQETRLEIK